MANKNLLLLIGWNVVLTALLGWVLLRKSAPAAGGVQTSDQTSTPEAVIPASTMTTDTAALKDAHIAFFFMDTVVAHAESIKESDRALTNLGQGLQSKLAAKRAAAEARYQELQEKDYTYSTQAERDHDEQELQKLMAELQDLGRQAQQQYDSRESAVLKQITTDIDAFLHEYNQTQGFDFILKVQAGDGVWIGNYGLDITADVVAGLNAKHRAKKSAELPAGK